MSNNTRITVNPEVRGGRPCIRGSRIRAKDILDMLAGGSPREDSSPTTHILRTRKLQKRCSIDETASPPRDCSHDPARRAVLDDDRRAGLAVRLGRLRDGCG